MYARFASQAWRSVRGHALLTLGLLLAVMMTVAGPLSSPPAVQAAGQASFVYQPTFNGAQFDSGNDEVVDEDGNAYILANTYDPPITSSTGDDAMILKLSPGDEASGRATMTTATIRNNVKSVIFTVASLTKTGSTYDSASNHDPDGDSNGTIIVVSRP
jgi:hypothetical protein